MNSCGPSFLLELLSIFWNHLVPFLSSLFDGEDIHPFHLYFIPPPLSSPTFIKPQKRLSPTLVPHPQTNKSRTDAAFIILGAMNHFWARSVAKEWAWDLEYEGHSTPRQLVNLRFHLSQISFDETFFLPVLEPFLILRWFFFSWWNCFFFLGGIVSRRNCF